MVLWRYEELNSLKEGLLVGMLNYLSFPVLRYDTVLTQFS